MNRGCGLRRMLVTVNNRHTAVTPALGPAQLIGLLIFALRRCTSPPSWFFLFFIIVQSISERNRASGDISWSHVRLALISFILTWSYVRGFTAHFRSS